MDVTPEQSLRAWVEYLRDMGIYDLYRRDAPATVLPEGLRQRILAASAASLSRTPDHQKSSDSAGAPGNFTPSVAGRRPPTLSAIAVPASPSLDARTASLDARTASLDKRSATRPTPVASDPAKIYFSTEAELPQALPPELAAPMPKPQPLESLSPMPTASLPAAQRAAALLTLQAEIGDCTRCSLAYAGRHTIVFGEGDPNAKLMFIGEGPGADEDENGRPFVGKAGQLLNNMITAMGIAREAVYIANIVKCRPPGNRAPEFVEATTCSQFLLRQIDIIRPKVIVALGATAATYVLGVRQSLASLRGEWFPVRGAKVAVTYHPAFLLRDPRQKGEAWKDLQRVMAELELQPAAPKKSCAVCLKTRLPSSELRLSSKPESFDPPSSKVESPLVPRSWLPMSLPTSANRCPASPLSDRLASSEGL